MTILHENAAELSLATADLTGFLRDVLQKGADFRFRASGCSMSPFIKDGDVITISPSRSTDLHVGDIAAFTEAPDDRLIVHRIIGIPGRLFIIKGDNARSQDSSIPASRILGCVTRIERGGRNVRLGLGPERRLVALLSRLHLLPLMFLPARILLKFRIRRHPATEMPAVPTEGIQ